MKTTKAERLKDNGDIIIGRNSIAEALSAGRSINAILIAPGTHGGSVSSIIKKARELKIPIKETTSKKLDAISAGERHQGIIAIAAAYEYAKVSDILSVANQKDEQPFIIIADGIMDPHNLGAIIRTAECSGAHGVIIPARRAVGLTLSVSRAAAGAVEHMKIARVGNLADEIDKLKTQGLWIYCADIGGQPYCTADLTGPVALVVGSEGSGISCLIKSKCDFTLSLPLCGKVNSLNASVAASVIMYEVTRQRLGLAAK